MTIKGEKIVLMGASYVRGWNLREIAGKSVINKGVNGDQTLDMLIRFNRDVIEEKPQAVLIWGFINDIFCSEKNDLLKILDASRENLKKMVFISREHSVQPVLATEITICGPKGYKEAAVAFLGKFIGKKSYQDYVNKHVRNVNLWIRKYAKENRIILLDFEAVLSDKLS